MMLKLQQKVDGNMTRGRQGEQKLPMTGRWDLVWLRSGKVIETVAFNDITNQGKNLIFDVMFNTATQIANNSWFIGLISLSGYSALAASDTMASHAGWTELTGYSQANRVAWGSGAAASQSITNATAATFDFTGSGTVKGIFVTTSNTKGGTSGSLWSTALFSADVPVVNGDQLKATYTINA